MKKYCIAFLLFLSLFSFFFCTYGYSSEPFETTDPKVTLTLHNVGIGQCYDLEIYDFSKKKKKVMLIGFGVEESFFKENPSKIPSKKVSDKKIRLRASAYRFTRVEVPLSTSELIRELRSKFKRDEGEGIEIDDVILTHPMKDPGLIMNLFNHESDHLGQLWLAGLPEYYYQENHDQFWTWMKERSARKTNIYFLALKDFTLDTLYKKEGRKYKPAYFTDPVKEGEELLNFSGVKVSFLSMNPTHFQGRDQEILKSSFPEDTQSDSLILKIINGSTSVVLTGNATSLTTNRVLNNYVDSLKSVQANIVIASAYGSTFQGANDKEWLDQVNPEYVILSHGASHLTFEQALYDSFKSLKGLKDSVTLHNIQVQVPEVQTYPTNQGIFSTLSSGTITINLYKKDFTIKTEKEGEITQTLKTLERMENQKHMSVLVNLPKSSPRDVSVKSLYHSHQKTARSYSLDLRHSTSSLPHLKENASEKKKVNNKQKDLSSLKRKKDSGKNHEYRKDYYKIEAKSNKRDLNDKISKKKREEYSDKNNSSPEASHESEHSSEKSED
jgi:hypothetical protein